MRTTLHRLASFGLGTLLLAAFASTAGAAADDSVIDRNRQQANAKSAYSASGEMGAQGFQEDFVNVAGPAAQRVRDEYDIPASVTVGQSILESNWGRSTLSANDRNYFGFKCTSPSNPGPIAISCHAYTTQECTPQCHDVTAYFRVYRTMEDSFRDYGRLLTTSSYYAGALPYRHEPDRFITEVAKNYATDPDYASKVIGLMRTYDLYRFEDQSGADGSPSVVSMRDGHQEMFARGGDGRVWHKWWYGGTWSDWVALDGVVGSAPSAVSMRDGHVELFARGVNGDLLHRWYYEGGQWSGWASLGGTLASAPSAVSMRDGHLEVFARGTGGDVIHTWWYGGDWSGWASLGGQQITGAPAAVSMTDNHIELFARAAGGDVIHAWYYGNGWNGWASLGGNTQGSPAAVSMYNGHLELFARGTDNAIWHKYYYAGGTWSDWGSLGGNLTGSPSALSMHAGHIELFARGTDNQLWHKYYYDPNPWSDWGSLGAI